MIDALLAKRLIERITKYTEYNVNIMDEKGIIIASKNTSRIGTFHEVALQIIQGEKEKSERTASEHYSLQRRPSERGLGTFESPAAHEGRYYSDSHSDSY